MKKLLLLLVPALLSSAQTVTTFAGNGTAGFSGDNDLAVNAEINRVVSLAADAAGNIYMADQDNNRVRKVDTRGTITTFAGNGTAGFNGDGGSAILAQLSGPLGVCLDKAGDVYVNDEGNNRVRKISTSGIITTVAGNGSATPSGDGGAATQAGMYIPIRCAVDTSGNLFIVDQGAHEIRKVDTNGIISTFAGTGSPGFSGDGGPATAAAMNNPTAATFDAAGNLFVSDQFNQRIREINTSGIIQTVAGSGSLGFSGDGGQATSASLNYPGSTAIDSSGSLFIVDSANNRIRKVSSGVITSIAGTGNAGFADGPATSAQFNSPFAMTLDGFGNLYVGDLGNNRLRKISGAAVGTGPAIAAVSNAASFQPGFASATWVSIFGTNLSGTTRGWQAGDFVGSLLPTSLTGISVTIDGLPAYVEYISATQLNVLAPDDAKVGAVQVQVTTPQGASNSFTAQKQTFAPAFFTIGGGYLAALHADYVLVGKLGLIPGAVTQPAKPGEVILLYATGFGPTSPPLPSSQLVTTPAVLPSTPQVTIGGVAAPVAYAGLVEAGLYQLNVKVPSLPDGDAAVIATIGGVQTQPGVSITIQH